MKIAHIYKDFYPITGGIENYIHILSNELNNRVQVEVIISSRSMHKESLTLDNVNIKRIPEIIRLNSMPILPTLILELKNIRVDLLHFHMPFPMGDVSYLLSGSKIPAIASYHSDVIRQKISNIFYKPVLNKFLKKTKKIIVSSKNYADSSPVLLKFIDKIVSIPYGIDIGFFNPSSHPDDIEGKIREKYGDKIILYVGVLRYYKGLNVLVEAMKYVDGKLIIIGRGPEYKTLSRLIYKNNLEGKILMAGSVTNFNLLPYYRSCDVFVLPSVYRSEAFGIVLLEAMACGRPVISTELGTGTSWVNQHGVTGLVVPPGDPKALADAINKMLDDRELADRFGANARKRVEENFTKELMADKIYRVYEDVLREG